MHCDYGIHLKQAKHLHHWFSFFSSLTWLG